MEMTFFQKNLDPREEKAFIKHLQEKTPAIEALLTHFSSDAAILKVSIEKFEKHDAYEAEFHLTLPTKSLYSKEASHQLKKSLDLCKDRLLSQIKKHMDHLRKDRKSGSIKEETPQMVESSVEVL
ncbi:hypothetical protein KJ632_03790 [Patescibacteria group bacterium]|nr:hypothetical protein [Patescibacteria group bacterium]